MFSKGPVVIRGWAEDCCMCGYLVIDGWNSRQKVPVNIIGETADGFEIEAIERVFLPGRGILKEGQSAFVPKITVKLGARESFRSPRRHE